MVSSRAFREKLWVELWQAGLVADSSQFRATYAEVKRLGRVEQKSIRPQDGWLSWWRGLIAVGQPWPGSAERILGWGRLLTEFFIAPLMLAGEQREAVARLGALENLIVSLYDSLIDWRGAGPEALPRAALELAATERAQPAVQHDGPPQTAASSMMAWLTSEYFSQLNHLSSASVHGHVRDTVGRAILVMYDAERSTVTRKPPDGSMSKRRMILRTSACPFVVMGLPAWLVTPRLDTDEYAWHFRWLYRLGEFGSWIDQAVDWDVDVATQQPNLIVSELAGTNGDGRAATNLAHRIALRGVRLMSEWDSRVDPDRLPVPACRSAIQTCIASWFGADASVWG